MSVASAAIAEIGSPSLPGIVDYGQIVYPRGATFGPRRQSNVQLVLVYRGWAEVTLDGQRRVRVGEGEVTLLLPGPVEVYQFATGQETHHTWVHLGYGPHEAPPAVATGLPSVRPISSELRRLMDAGLGLGPPSHGLRSVHARLLGLAMLWAYAEAAGLGGSGASSGRGAPPLPPAVERAQRHMLDHLADPLQLADLAAAASVTPSHLVRVFQQHLGTTPMRRLWELRARRGVELLRDTGLSVSEVAYRVGCQTPYHFSRLIRRHAGEPPTALRKRLWGG